MRVKIVLAAAVVLAAVGAARGRETAAKEIQHLQAALAESNKRIADLVQHTANLRDKISQLLKQQADLKDEVARLKQQMLVARAGAPKGALSHKLDIRVKAGGWGGASTADIKKVLASAAGELWKHFPDRKLPPIIVEHGNSGPIVLYRKGPAGEHIVRLDVEGTYWCQFAYQFAHEFCHILTNYRRTETKKNKWLIESLCETASLYAMRRMAETWRTAPPYPNWKSYAPSLRKYADNARAKKDLRVAAGGALAAWYRKNADQLRGKATLRDKNKVVASVLLDLLEADPAAWRAAGDLNLSAPDKDDGFEAFLADWLKRTPQKHRAFVRKVIALFEVKLPAG